MLSFLDIICFPWAFQKKIFATILSSVAKSFFAPVLPPITHLRHFKIIVFLSSTFKHASEFIGFAKQKFHSWFRFFTHIGPLIWKIIILFRNFKFALCNSKYVCDNREFLFLFVEKETNDKLIIRIIISTKPKHSRKNIIIKRFWAKNKNNNNKEIHYIGPRFISYWLIQSISYHLYT